MNKNHRTFVFFPDSIARRKNQSCALQLSHQRYFNNTMFNVFFFTASAFALSTPESTMKVGMWTLNSWGVANIATGVPLAVTHTDVQTSAFYQMNAGWNFVNVGLASTALISAKPVEPQRMARIFWINTGLDVAYVLGGVALTQRAQIVNDPQMLGWGRSIMLQGGFLFGFDAVMAVKMMRY